MAKAASHNPATESHAEEFENKNPSSPSDGINPDHNVCLLRFTGDSVAGALMGSIFGYSEFPLRPLPLSIF
ncbi:putative mitochondrial import inner membrane translocase subunit TIM22-3-like [Cocos nucifera]|nr:putative mitochondrial import inner membrane translocase subunit TIM22-3-like [Cocos nucifera]